MNTVPEQQELKWQRAAEQALNRRDYRQAHELCLRMLMHRPDSADAFFLLAMIAADHDNYAKAIDVIGRALRIDPDRAEFHAHLGRCQIALHRPRAAYEAAHKALALDPRDALTLDTIGVVMTRAGAHADALAPFARAVALDSSKPAYQYNLGAALQFAGRFEEAAGAYRKAIELDPLTFRAWSSLAQVKSAPFTPGEVGRLIDLVNRQDLDADAQLHLCHALAKQHEDSGEYAQAFTWLVRGKQAKRAPLNYDFAVDQAVFVAARAAAPTLNAYPAGCSSAEPIFIVGMPRTGTTLVERILSSHPAVFAAGELTNFALVVKRAAGTASRRVLDPETLAATAPLDFAKVGSEYVESTRPRTGHTPHFIDKMPLNFFYAALIRRALPNARIICLRRNPLDTCLSNYRQLFATSFSYYNYAYDLLDTGRYYIEFASLADHWRATLGDRYHEVRYESVVDDTEGEARRLIAFCGLDWDPACLSFQDNAAPVATASSVQVRQPIYRTAVERWRKYEAQLRPLQALFDARGIAWQ